MNQLTNEEKQVFNNIIAAAADIDDVKHEGLCLVRAKHRVSGKEVAMVCRATPDEDGVTFYPLAVLLTTQEAVDEYTAI